ncbi:MAG: ATP-dependent metallopeptidase FtsH/Yme1/Tma family protein, partial [Geodermatophilaceae bacterium]|nr:ATP-dependent metallopeptidase FtsH/Yme1/Tma family protein [Geodermatophilaceae bacterium]
MERKRLIRSPWLWVGLAVLLFFVVQPLFSGGDDFTEVKTSVALEQLESGNVSEATINDKEQTLDLTLDSAVDGASQITASYPLEASDEVFDLVRNAEGSGSTYDTSVSQDNIFVSILLSLLPFVLLIFLLFWFMNS